MVQLAQVGAALGFGAVVVDVTLIRGAQAELQASLDAAALSAAEEFDGTLAGIDRAGFRASEIATRNGLFGRAVSVPPSEIRFGMIDPDTKLFVPWMSGDDPFSVNTLSLTHPAEPVLAALGEVVFGVRGYHVEAPSGARRPKDAFGAGSTGCYLPLAVPECSVEGLAPNSNPVPYKFSFATGSGSRISWSLADHNPDSNRVRDQLLGSCDGLTLRKGQQVHVNQGQHNSALHTVADIIAGAAPVPATDWDTESYGAIPERGGPYANAPNKSGVSQPRWGKVLEGVIPLVDGGEDCSDLDLTGTLPITRFAWAVIYDVSESGKDKNLYVLLDVTKWHSIWGVPDATVVTNIRTFGDPALTDVSP